MNTWIAGKDLMKHHYQIKKDFYSELNLEDITDKDYEHYQKVWEEFGLEISVIITTCIFKVIHDCLHMYLKTVETNVLKYMNLILLIFYLHQDQSLVTAVMKAKFTKAPPKYVHYPDYKNFNEQDFKLELRGKLEDDVVEIVDANYETFHIVYLNVLKEHDPIKSSDQKQPSTLCLS